MKHIILRILLFLICFIGGVFGINRLLGGDSGDYSMEMDPATLPVIYANVTNTNINPMHGYTSDIDASLLRNSVTPLVDGKVNLVIDQNRYEVKKLHYEVRSDDGSSLVEDGDLDGFKTNKKGYKTLSLKPRMQLKTDRGYLLKLVIENSGVNISYYTHIINKGKLHLEKELKFITSMSKALLDKNEALNYQQYLESDPGKVSNDLGNVTITDSFESITYADMKPQFLYNPTPVITEVGEDTLSVRMNFYIMAESSKSVTEYYEVTEDYKVKFSTTRMYLLSYDRSISSSYDPAFTSSTNNGLKMGISSQSTVPYITSNGNRLIAFVKNRELYLYDYQHVQMYKIFSFMQGEYSNIYSNYNQHDIQLISLDDKGNLSFAVHGYMNRGRHEGQNGVLFYKYDMDDKQIIEEAFIPTKEPFSTLKEDVKDVCYMNDSQDVYLVLSGVLYVVHMQERRFEVLMEKVTSDRVVSSADHHLLGVINVDNRSINVMNLSDDKSMTVSADAKDRLKVVGFVSEDLVLGKIHEDDIVVENEREIAPVYEVDIVNWDGQVIKSYEPPSSNKFIMDVNVTGNLVEIILSKKRGDTFVNAGSDWIMSNDDDEKDTVTLDYIYNTVRYKELYIIYPNTLYINDIPELALAKETRIDDNRMFEIDSDATGSLKYYIYENGEIVESVESVVEAVDKAYESGGGVITSKQKTIWEKSGILEYATVGDDVSLIGSSADDSLKACVGMILSYEGKNVPLKELKESDDDIFTIINDEIGCDLIDFKGCTMDEMMYYICKGHPVITKLDGHYVLLTSFNSERIRYYDPVKNEVVVTSYSDVNDKIKSGGNVFYGYVR